MIRLSRFSVRHNITLVVAVLFVATFFYSNIASAITYDGPDPSEYGGAEDRYVLARSDETGDQSYMEIPIYYKGASNPGSVGLLVHDIVRGDSYWDRIYGRDPQNHSQTVSVNGGDSFYTDNYVSVGNFSWDNSTDLWRSVVNFRLINTSNPSFWNNRIAFRLSLPNDNGKWLIGNATGGASGYFNTIASNPDPWQGITYNYAIQFATPCDIHSNTVRDIELFDLDSGMADNEYSPINVYISDETGSSYDVGVPSHGSMGQNGHYYLSMTFQPSHRYILHVNYMSPINHLQYKFPYDNVTYATGCSNYELTPTINLSDSAIETGASLTVSSSVKNSGPTVSADTRWWVKKTVYTYTADDTLKDTSNYNIADERRVFSVGSNTNFDIRNDTVNEPVGSKVCYTLYVQPGSSKNNESVSSNIECAIVGKKPKVHVIGGDLKTRGGTNTSISPIGQTTYGSWAEYAISAGGSVVGTSSGMGLVGGQVINNNACNYSVLTFNNDNSENNSKNAACTATSTLGHYSNTNESLPDIASNFATSSDTSGTLLAGSIVNPSTLESKVYKVNGDLTLGSDVSTLAKSQSVILNVTGTVTIDANQLYANGPYDSISQIPQLVIIAKNIVINDKVTNVNAWLIAKDDKTKDGYIKTCKFKATKVSDCSEKLTVVGPVVTDKLYLYRTFGADQDSRAEAAETFNFRADAYLWAYNYALTHAGMKTVYSTELPPRF